MSLALSPRRAILMPGPWVRDELWRRARAVPSLDLRFADSKSLIDVISGLQLITYTRAGSGTSVGSGGLVETAGTNVPRFDHDPTTGECLGLLMEEQRTNLLLRSEEFDNASWSKVRITISENSIASPNGQLTADKIIEDNTNSDKTVTQRVTITAGATYTYSGYIKAGERTQARLLFRNSTYSEQVRISVDLATGLVTLANASGGGTLISHSFTGVGNGWYRFVLTGSLGGSTTAAGVNVYPMLASSTVYTGDGTSGIYIWGAQLEAGAFPTSYIPTTTATATRSADVASITGANFSSWYRQDEGTVFASSFALKNASGVVWGVGDTFSNVIYMVATTANNFFVRSADTLHVALSASVSSSTTSNTCVAYKVNDFAAVSGGGAVSTDTSGAVPVSPIRLKLGGSAWDEGGTNVPCGHIRRLTYWPQRLSNSALQALTR